MSFSLGIHVWWNDFARSQETRRTQLLNSVANFKTPFGSETVFRSLQTFEGCFSEVSRRAIAETTDSLIFSLSQRPDPALCSVLSAAIDFRDFEGDSIASDTVIALDIIFYGLDYCLGGSYYKSRGPVQLTFDNVQSFQPYELTGNHAGVESPAVAASDQPSYERLVLTLVTNIVRDSDPDHIVVCTESEVHPLTSHSIYHRNWRYFFDDLVKIAKLNEFGGLYFCEISDDDPAFQRPRKLDLDYGYLRGRFGDNTSLRLQQTLKPLTVDLLAHENFPATQEIVDSAFASLKNTHVARINGGYLVTAVGAPFVYLEELYLTLYDRLRYHSS